MAASYGFRIAAEGIEAFVADMGKAAAGNDQLTAAWNRFIQASPGLQNAMARAQEEAGKTASRFQALNQANEQAGASSSRLGQVVGQAGFQIQDFAVQVAGGQNAMVAFAQQGSQLLGVFGGFGAVAGAALAIGAVVAQLVAGKTAAEKWKEAIEGQKDLYTEATQRAEALEAALRRQGDQYSSAADAGRRYRDGLQGEAQTLIQLAEYYQRLGNEERELARIEGERSRGRLATQSNALLTEAGNSIGGRVAVAEGRGVDLSGMAGQLSALSGVTAELPPALQKVVEAYQRLRDGQTVSVAGFAELIRTVRQAADGSRENAAELRHYEDALVALLPRVRELEEALRRAGVQQQALTGGGASVDLLRARETAASVGGAYQTRERINDQIGKIRAGQAAAEGPEEAARFASSLQALNAQLVGLTPATTQYIRGLEEAADLARSGGGAARELAAAEQAVNIAARQAGAGQASAAEITRARTAVQRRLLEELINSRVVISDANNATLAEAEAMGQGARAADEARIAVLAETEAKKSAKPGTEEYRVAVEVLTASLLGQRDANDQLRDSRALDSQRQQLELTRAEIGLVGASVQEREREIAALRERQRIISEKGDPDSADSQKRITGARELATTSLELERQRSAYQELGRIGEAAFDKIGTAITTAFVTGKRNAVDFGGIARAVLSEILQYALKIAVIRPLGNALFGTNNATAADLAGGGGGSGGGGFLSLFSGSGTGGIFSSGTTAATPAASTGAAASGAPGAGGASAAGGFSTAMGAAAPYLAGAGLGMAAGGMTSSARGTVDGTRNSAAGTAIGMGIGAFFGPVGALVGAVIGGAIGGLVGPTKKGMEQRAGGDVFLGVDDKGQLVITSSRGKRWDEAGSRSEVQAQLDAINDALGQRELTVGSAFAGTVGFGKASKSLHEISQRDVIASLQSGNASVATGLATLTAGGADNLDKVLGKVDWIKQVYEPMRKASEATDEWTLAIDNINEKYAAVIKQTQELGLATDAVTKARDKEIASVQTQRNATAKGLLEQLTIGGVAGLSPEARGFAALSSLNAARQGVDGTAAGLDEYARVASAALPVLREVFGTNEAYGRTVAEVASTLRAASPNADMAGLATLLESQATGTDRVAEAVLAIGGDTNDLLGRLLSEFSTLRGQLEALARRVAA